VKRQIERGAIVEWSRGPWLVYARAGDQLTLHAYSPDGRCVDMPTVSIRSVRWLEAP
jgi:hypothetical protein